MSTAAAAAADAPPAKGKKKLIIIIVAVLLLVLLGGGAALLLLKKKSADAADGGDGDGAPAKAARHDPKKPPSFVPLDSFTVNLADKQADRYAQIGITLEVDDEKVAEEIKKYMPAIRNNILLAISERTAADLLDREGKKKLAETIRLETARAMGYDVPREADAAASDSDGRSARRSRKAEADLPVRAVQFSNFIIQ
ncbi:MAG: flagellar basal body-associated FliL family protein [Burkholderiales bacterium]|nr:flagellar basal body-associated FliL family protein [Burkholderiales bacterium]MDE1929591.1 flagellar basal body-associated FliL family protein [Burkholderiales bacterium]MDE2160778.1 flagellar basal body-associated FliL family protein [Burkholderiales bacterium]MDE2505378.1 flagellar basal body-associated FliL family protein [Burkholderiales bacterium]